MKDLLIIGAGNFGREVAQLIRDINQDKLQWNLLGYIDETPEKHDVVFNNTPVLGGVEWLEKNIGNKICAICAIGNPKDKFNLLKKISNCNMEFPNLIHPNVATNDYIQIGYGNIICWGSFLSVNIKIGNHVSINPGCGIGHDTVIKDYTTLYWDVTLSGNVTIHEGCEIGSKSAVIQQRSVGGWSIIGAGAVVVKDIPENCTAVGVPAKPIKFSNPIN
jgi:sugar O-acyltransferase (sialic acid O-acetyltransferase NeuD family)